MCVMRRRGSRNRRTPFYRGTRIPKPCMSPWGCTPCYGHFYGHRLPGNESWDIWGYVLLAPLDRFWHQVEPSYSSSLSNPSRAPRSVLCYTQRQACARPASDEIQKVPEELVSYLYKRWVVKDYAFRRGQGVPSA